MATKVTFPNSRMASIRMAGGIREILTRAEQMEREGRSIIHMELGRPDFDSPKCAKDRVVRELAAGNVHYTDMAGSYELRAAVAAKYRRENNMPFVDADKNVVITNGAMEALTASFLTLFEPGDEVIVQTPYFSAYADELAIANAILVPTKTTMEDGFCLRRDALEAAYTPKSKAILLNSPNNPSGAVLSRESLEEIAAFAREHDLWVISDECYEKFVYGAEHVSIASLPGMAERTVTVSAASKTWSMTGWRIGWVVAPEAMRPYVNKCHQNLTTCANSFAQAGVVTALEEAAPDVTAMVAEYKRRRDMVVARLAEIPGFESITPEGAFYAFPRIASLGMDGFTFCNKLLEEAGVSAVPSEVFGMPGHIRIAYCREYEYIEEGLRRIKAAVEGMLKNKK